MLSFARSQIAASGDDPKDGVRAADTHVGQCAQIEDKLGLARAGGGDTGIEGKAALVEGYHEAASVVDGGLAHLRQAVERGAVTNLFEVVQLQGRLLATNVRTCRRSPSATCSRSSSIA